MKNLLKRQETNVIVLEKVSDPVSDKGPKESTGIHWSQFFLQD